MGNWREHREVTATARKEYDVAEYSREEWLGQGRISPAQPAHAGHYGSWTIEYTVGVSGIDDGGRIRLAFRTVSDWATPQFTDPGEPNYVSLHTNRAVRLVPVYGPHGVRPWTKTLTIQVEEGPLFQGDTVRIILGDRGFGGPGFRAQTYPEREFHIQLLADPFGTGLYETVDELGFPVIGGPAEQLLVTAPSDVAAGESAWLQVRALDAWGNPDPTYRGRIDFTGDPPQGCPESYAFQPVDEGVHRFDDVQFPEAGIRHVTVADAEHGFSATSNPIRCHAQPPDVRLYWADLHGQTRETVGAGTIPEYFAYARDIAAVDATAHSGNDFQITGDVYTELRQNAEHFHEPHRFVTFHGYEWSGNTPAGGDRNVYYFDDGPIRRSSHTQIRDTSDSDTDCYPVDRLYAANAGRDDVILIPHIGGRRATLDYHDPELEPAIEIASQWGRFEWFALDALERGMRVAFMGGSDDHSGRPGWSWATLAHHGTRGGLTAFLASELTREGIWEAFKARRCYGTSGPRIILDVSVNGHPMGSEPVLTGQPRLSARVLGTAPIESVEVRRNTETVSTYTASPEPEPGEPWRVRIAWRGARNRGRSRALDWTGSATIWNGRITGVENYAIDNAIDGVAGWDDQHLAWRSHTCGDWDGVILDLDVDDDTVLDITTRAMSLQTRLGDLKDGAIRQRGSLLEQQLVVQRLSHREARREVTLDWTDHEPRAGWNPYWIWVTQADGELAWSTPVYVYWQG